MTDFNEAPENSDATVMAEYAPSGERSDACQSEAELEAEFIRVLESRGYERLPLRGEADLIANLRRQLEALNACRFSDNEWENFFRDQLANANESALEKTRKIQVEGVLNLIRDDGSVKNITLLDKKNVLNNRLQVINQYAEKGGERAARYDMTVLVNGIPLVHAELKRRGVPIREAFNQINRYRRENFWGGFGLFEYVQIFVISNGVHTKYYSSTIREKRLKERGQKSGASFEFTSWWTDAANNIISDLTDFAKTFFAPRTLLNILARFCVFTASNELLVMRPYQIAASERILRRIEYAHKAGKAGTLEAGGFIWHTTGSGKTLTSFKTAQLAACLPYVDKVLFVVDRRDLDYQTMVEYDKFEKGAANGNNSVKKLTEQLNGRESRIIVTTIQKLGVFVKRYPDHPVFRERVVLIFDECHRSQFGELHAAITKAFKNYHIFGFTGTPIFPVNSGAGTNPALKTTEQAFGDKLHAYTIVNAINDGAVLPFRVDYLNTVKMADDVKDYKVGGVDCEKALLAPERIAKITNYILEHFGQKTRRDQYYSHKGKTLAGFNSILAVASIPAAMAYYAELKKQLAERGEKLKIAVIFSHNPNEADPEDASFDAESLDITSREFLARAIGDYNRLFQTAHDISADKFHNYYKDLSRRMKKRELDLLVVVNMFLTGFDAKTLNTLWVDKNLRYHSLLQAFSRTNRILNSVKTFGNIVCFRDLKEETDQAVALFGDKDAGGVVLTKSFAEFYEGYDEEKADGTITHIEGYRELVTRLLSAWPDEGAIVGEEAEKEFIRLFGKILRLRNILASFDEFAGNEILSPRRFQDYQGIYLDLYQKRRREKPEKENIVDDLVFEIELARQIEINLDYILALIEKYRAGNRRDKTLLAEARSAVNSSLELRSKKELIEGFIRRINADVIISWPDYVRERKEADLNELIRRDGLRSEETRRFLERAFKSGELPTVGEELQNILPPTHPFKPAEAKKRKGIIERVKEFFEKYLGAA